MERILAAPRRTVPLPSLRTTADATMWLAISGHNALVDLARAGSARRMSASMRTTSLRGGVRAYNVTKTHSVTRRCALKECAPELLTVKAAHYISTDAREWCAVWILIVRKVCIVRVAHAASKRHALLQAQPIPTNVRVFNASENQNACLILAASDLALAELVVPSKIVQRHLYLLDKDAIR